jgi:hypothetical protein
MTLNGLTKAYLAWLRSLAGAIGGGNPCALERYDNGVGRGDRSGLPHRLQGQPRDKRERQVQTLKPARADSP